MNVVVRMHALWRDDSGQDLLEYALLGSLIALGAYVAVESTGSSVNSLYNTIATKMEGVLQ
jgi:Flp pilus assembly pilin Flp